MPRDALFMSSVSSSTLASPSDGLWMYEEVVYKGDLFASAKSTSIAASVVHQLIAENADPDREEPIRILDLGCGTGMFGVNLDARRNADEEVGRGLPSIEITGLDANTHALNYLMKQVPIVAGPKTIYKELHHFNLLTNREGLFDRFEPASFDIVVSNDFLLQDPTLGFPGMTGLYLAMDLVRPDGALICCNNSAISQPSILRGYLGALSAGRGDEHGQVGQAGSTPPVIFTTDPQLTFKTWLEDPLALKQFDKDLPLDGQLPVWVHVFHRKW